MPELNIGFGFDAVLTDVIDSRGQPTTVVGIPVWESSDPSVVTAVATADGLGAAIDAVGSSVDGAFVTCTVGDGETQFVVTSETITVPLGVAVAGSIDLGEPVARLPA